MKKSTRGTLLLLLAALIWGMAFVAQSSAADSIGSFTFNATRSLLASLFLFLVIGVRKFFGGQLGKTDNKTATGGTLRAGIICGLILFFSVNLQQFGIAIYPESVAASGRAGFLTATYVIMVALLSLIMGKRLRMTVVAATAVCIAGMYLLCLTDGFSGLYFADILILGGALGFALYVFAIDSFSKLDGLKISCIQFFVCGVISLIAMFIFEKPDINALLAAWLPIAYVGVFSSGMGYTLQILGQRYAEPAVASIAMSLESVFAALAGWVILHERLNVNELIGCALVFASVLLAQVPDFIGKSRSKEYTE